MDYKQRKYYLVKIFKKTEDSRIECFKKVAPSIKILSAYNHFPSYEKDQWGRARYSYDGSFSEKTGIEMPGLMLSCRIDESASLECELEKMVEQDGIYSQFCELTKSLCAQ